MTDTPHIEYRSVLSCPECGHRETLTMPDNYCLWYHDCTGCGALLRPKGGDCCVFCSYGTVSCPPIQKDGGCCG